MRDYYYGRIFQGLYVGLKPDNSGEVKEVGALIQEDVHFLEQGTGEIAARTPPAGQVGEWFFNDIFLEAETEEDGTGSRFRCRGIHLDGREREENGRTSGTYGLKV